MKSMLKSELAERAGVSLSTFGRWLKRHTEELERLTLPDQSHLSKRGAKSSMSRWGSPN